MTAPVLNKIIGGATAESRADAAAQLRYYADRIESGECTDYVLFAVDGGYYRYRSWAKLVDAVALTSMANAEAILKMRE